jgi:uracil-DNA glycosylase
VSRGSLDSLLKEVRACRTCEPHLPLGPRPVLRASRSARILIIGQAPGTKVHESGIPWNDASGKRLRDWMQIGFERFYDEKEVAIIPMGFCYPGKGKSGDLPPRPECAELWHEKLLARLPNLQLRLLIGKYAQDYYLGTKRQSLAQTVQNRQDYLPDYFPLPHPSPRNIRWFKLNPWFESEVIPSLRDKINYIYQ